MQHTLVIFKPDCVQRRLVGQILQRFEAKGLRIDAMKFLHVDRPLAERHYAEHRERSFFGGLIDFITGGPVVVAIFAGPEAIAVVRQMIGPTNGAEAPPGTIRGDFALSKQNNLIHASDGPDSADREIGIWFKPEEIAPVEMADTHWVLGGTPDDTLAHKYGKKPARATK